MSRVGQLFFAAMIAIVLGAFLAQPGHPQDFGQPVIYPLPQEAKTVVTGDFNSDGREDAAVAAWPSGLYVFYQQQDGTLGSPTELFASQMPSGMAVGDLNGDGRLDLAVGGLDGVILLYYQGSDGAFGLPLPYQGYGRVDSLAIGDFNSDGLADLVSTYGGYPLLLVSTQLPDGTFDLPGMLWLDGSNPRCLRTLDLNADGRRDLGVLLDNQFAYLLGGPTGLEPPQYAPAMWASSMAAGDVTGDSVDDIVFSVGTNQPDAAFGVFSSGAAAPALYAAYDMPQAITAADINGDGRDEVIAAHAGYEAVTVSAIGGASTVYAAPYCNSYMPEGLTAGDLNGDGQPDLALADWWNGLVVLPHVAVSRDTTAPVVSVESQVAVLWPPNGATVNVPVKVTASDADSGVATLHLAVEDEYGVIAPELEVAASETGTVVSVPLVASRDETDADGRTYTIVVTCTDKAGNVAMAAATVVVPHSNPAKPAKPRRK